jgi:hypothetical protein
MSKKKYGTFPLNHRELRLLTEMTVADNLAGHYKTLAENYLENYFRKHDQFFGEVMKNREMPKRPFNLRVSMDRMSIIIEKVSEDDVVSQLASVPRREVMVLKEGDD